nr:ThuA domain-containing protein [Chthoniobacterales bacterium]
EVTIDDELKHCTAEALKAFDVVMFVNTTKDLAIDESQKQALLDFIKSGKGFVGVHAATDTFYGWLPFGEMIGGYFDGHPWNASDTVTIKVEKPEHPVAKPFGDAPFELTEEIYQMREPYDRNNCEVLLSLDTSKTDMTKSGIKRTDGDFAVAWIKPYGEGRVFYTSLGHNQAVWRDKRFQEHLVAGIDWASGAGEPAKPGK